MKTTRTHIGLLLMGLLCLVAAGCAIRIPDNPEPDVALTFDPVMYAAFKSDGNGGEYPVDRDFRVSVWSYAPADGIRAANPFITASRVSHSDGRWAPIPAAFWPSQSSRIVALAASPYEANASIDLESGVVFTNIDTANQTDLLYTDPIAGLSRNTAGGVVDLPFRHALCLVDFELRCNGSSDQEVTVLGVTLDGLYTCGSFASLPDPVWHTTAEVQEVVFFAGEQAVGYNNQQVGNSRWTIPQPLSSKVSVSLRYREYADQEEATRTLQTIPFNLLLEPGRHYTLTLSCLLDTKALKIDILDDLL